MFIATERHSKVKLQRSETFQESIRLSNISLLWSCEYSMEANDYKHFVPTGLGTLVPDYAAFCSFITVAGSPLTIVLFFREERHIPKASFVRLRIGRRF